MADREYANTACPYCEAVLDPLPRAKKRCPSCGQPIHVRSGPDGFRYLLQEADLPVLEAAWAEWHAEQEWRSRALALVDEAELARTETEMRTKDPRYTNRDIYWTVANRDLIKRMEGGDWHDVKMAYFEMALAAWEEADDNAETTGKPPDLARPLRLMRESNLADLRDWGSAGVTRVDILSDCDRCSEGAVTPRLLSAEMDDPALPHAECETGLCRCEYLPLTR